MLRLSGVGLAATLLAGSALAQTPLSVPAANTVQADMTVYGGFFFRPWYNDYFYRFPILGGSGRANIPFGGVMNYELEVSTEGWIYGNGYAEWFSSIFAHLYARDPERYAIGFFGGYADVTWFDNFLVGGAEAQAYLGNSTFYLQALYGHRFCDGCEANMLQARSEIEVFVTPRTSIAGGAGYTRYFEINTHANVYWTTATLTQQFGPLAWFVQGQYDYDTFAEYPDENKHNFTVRSGIRILIGPPGTTLRSNATTGPAMDVLIPGFRISCFTAPTQILMADGTRRRISDVRVGEVVVGQNGALNRVLEIETPLLGDRKLYSFDGRPAFVTAEHPFMTRDGWKSIDPEATFAETGAMRVGTLTAADEVMKLTSVVALAQEMRAGGGMRSPASGVGAAIATGYAQLRSIMAHTADPTTPVFNLRLDGDNTYFANDYLVHNK